MFNVDILIWYRVIQNIYPNKICYLFNLLRYLLLDKIIRVLLKKKNTVSNKITPITQQSN